MVLLLHDDCFLFNCLILFKKKKPTTPPSNLKQVIIDIVNEQIASDEIPEVALTHERLIAEGFSDQEAKKLIGKALSTEIFGMLKEKNNYNRQKYIKTLAMLPKMPW